MANEMTHGLSEYLGDVVDDWCGTKPHGPFPHQGLGDVVFAGAIYNIAARVSDITFRERLQNICLELANTGIKTAAQQDFAAQAVGVRKG